MGDLAPMHRVLDFKCELCGWTHAAVHRECATKHKGGFIQAAAAGETRDKRFGMHHHCHGTFLVDSTLAVFKDKGPEKQLVPVSGNLIVGPELRSDWLVTHLLGNRDAIG